MSGCSATWDVPRHTGARSQQSHASRRAPIKVRAQSFTKLPIADVYVGAEHSPGEEHCIDVLDESPNIVVGEGDTSPRHVVRSGWVEVAGSVECHSAEPGVIPK